MIPMWQEGVIHWTWPTPPWYASGDKDFTTIHGNPLHIQTILIARVFPMLRLKLLFCNIHQFVLALPTRAMNSIPPIKLGMIQAWKNSSGSTHHWQAKGKSEAKFNKMKYDWCPHSVFYSGLRSRWERKGFSALCHMTAFRVSMEGCGQELIKSYQDDTAAQTAPSPRLQTDMWLQTEGHAGGMLVGSSKVAALQNR